MRTFTTQECNDAIAFCGMKCSTCPYSGRAAKEPAAEKPPAKLGPDARRAEGVIDG